MTVRNLYLVMSDSDKIDIFTVEENLHYGKVQFIPEEVLDMQVERVEVNKQYGYLEIEVQ